MTVIGPTLDRAALDDLRRRLPDLPIVTDADVLRAYERDHEAWSPSHPPAALARPASTSDVAQIMSWATRHRVPVVPRGAGSGLTGAANATAGCLVISTDRMNRVVEIDPADLVAVVQPGLLNADLKQAAAAAGLFYAPDPASSAFCSIGGNIATNAGGLCCLKYGVTRDSVLGLEVVLPDGEVLTTGGRTVKNVAGLDLTSLFVGSEGQLGFVTQATLRLHPAPTETATLVATFADLEQAGQAVRRIVLQGRPSMCELMDGTTIAAVEQFRPSGLDLDAAALLIVQSDGRSSAAEIDEFARLCDEAGATLTLATPDPEESMLITMARRLAVTALEALGQWILDDVCVPLSAVPALITGCRAISDRHGVLVACFGHAGDGNMHPTVVFPPGDAEAESAAMLAADAILDLARELGGTITGEHGVGLAKRSQMADQLGDRHLQLQRQIKAVFDPLGILNPGKSIG